MRERRSRFAEDSKQFIARAEQNADGAPAIHGYGIVFDVGYTVRDMFGPFVETVAPTAANKTLKEARDIHAYFNHDPSHVLGTQESKSLTVSRDDTGVPYAIVVDEKDGDAMNIYRKVETGRVPGSSVAMSVVDDKWSVVDGMDHRLIKEIKLYEIGPVTMPANPETSAQTRSLLEDAEVDDWRVESAAIKLRRGIPLTRADLVAVNSQTFRDQLHALEPVEDDHSDAGTRDEALDTALLAAVERAKLSLRRPVC